MLGAPDIAERWITKYPFDAHSGDFLFLTSYLPLDKFCTLFKRGFGSILKSVFFPFWVANLPCSFKIVYCCKIADTCMAFLAKIGMHLFQNKRRSVNIILATLTTKISDKKLFLSPRSIFEIFSACSLYCCLPACDNFNLRHIEDKLQSRLSLSRSIPSFDSSLNIWSCKSIFFTRL